jgi:hypothetical protein
VVRGERKGDGCARLRSGVLLDVTVIVVVNERGFFCERWDGVG